MKEIKKQSYFEEPKLDIIELCEKDIISTSGDPKKEVPQEGEFISANVNRKSL